MNSFKLVDISFKVWVPYTTGILQVGTIDIPKRARHLYLPSTLAQVSKFGSILGMGVCTYVRTCHAVTLRNVNLQCRDVATKDGGGQRGWPFATYVFAEPGA